MATLDVGSYAFLGYDGFPLVHARLVGAWVQNSEYVVITPDYDIYILNSWTQTMVTSPCCGFQTRRGRCRSGCKVLRYMTSLRDLRGQRSSG